MNIFHVESVKLTQILCFLCSFWQFLPVKACFTITVIRLLTVKKFLCCWRQLGNVNEAVRNNSGLKCLGKLWTCQV